MSSKSGQRKVNLRKLRTLSITRRLTFLYTLCTLCLLGFSTALLDHILVTDIYREDSRFLAAEIHNFRMLMEKYPRNVTVWKEEMERETQASALTYMKYYVRVLDEEGRTEIETPGMDRIIGAASFPALSGSDGIREKSVRTMGQDMGHLLLATARVGPDPSGTKSRVIQIALDISHEDALIANYREKMALVLFTGMILSTLIGFAVAREGLRPLKSMGRVFKRIGAERLHDRLGSREWPDEIAVLARAFDNMLERLENSFVALSRFSADLAHELRTPINNLRGEAEVALYKGRTAEEYRQVLESSLEEYGRLSRMIEGLLLLARTENTEGQLKRKVLDVRREAENLLEFFEAVAEEKEIQVFYDGDAAVEADSTLFRHALTNILSNAFQYTPKGGSITVTTEEPGAGSVRVRVKDTGMGIEPENLARIFDRFFRTSRARMAHPQGTGLGFAIVKSIMDLHGGTVTVESEVDQGTIVTLEFPAHGP